MDHSWAIKNARRISPAGASHHDRKLSSNLLNLQMPEMLAMLAA
jgi:hypothetical protein